MNNWDNTSNGIDANNSFNGAAELMEIDNAQQTEIVQPTAFSGGQDVFSFNDPLKYSHLFQFEPLNLDLGNNHFVQPHYGDPYIRADGTLVDGYFRDGDGNTKIDRTIDQGGGYIRSNPDGTPFNNLKQEFVSSLQSYICWFMYDTSRIQEIVVSWIRLAFVFDSRFKGTAKEELKKVIF